MGQPQRMSYFMHGRHKPITTDYLFWIGGICSCRRLHRYCRIIDIDKIIIIINYCLTTFSLWKVGQISKRDVRQSRLKSAKIFGDKVLKPGRQVWTLVEREGIGVGVAQAGRKCSINEIAPQP